jgi:hypothetical protein
LKLRIGMVLFKVLFQHQSKKKNQGLPSKLAV